jgi:hypothetical protein
MITFLRFIARFIFSAILQHQLHGKQNGGNGGNSLPLASCLSVARRAQLMFSPATSWKASSPGRHRNVLRAWRCKVPLQLLLLLLLFMGSFLRGKRFTKVLHH